MPDDSDTPVEILPTRDPQGYYADAYHRRVHDPRFNAGDAYYWARAEAAARLYFQNLPRAHSGRVLEYGCGYGQNIATLPEAWGYDISPRAREVCQQHGVRVFDAPADIPFGAFDLVFSRHCLEHIEHPLENLRELGSYLCKDGLLVLVLPREGHNRVLLLPDHHQHLYCWNFRAINNLLWRAGYEVLHNATCSVVGYRALLPLRRVLGPAGYYWATRLAGRLYSVRELVIWARPAQNHEPSGSMQP